MTIRFEDSSSPLAAVPPTLPLPPGACDCHAHVFGPFDQFPIGADVTYVPPLGPYEAYTMMLRKVGVDRGVLVHPTAYGFDHSALVDALNRADGRLRGVGVLPPDARPTEFERLHAAGVRALRFTEVAAGAPQVVPGRVGLSGIAALAGPMRERGWHADVWTTAARFAETADGLLALGLPLVLDHMGYFGAGAAIDDPGFTNILRLLHDGRIWVKLSLCRNSADHGRYADLRPFHDALIAANPERLVWGSDWPFIGLDQTRMNPGRLMDIFQDWTSDATLRRRILVDNPAALYGFASASS